jgi:hypothetical protein
MMLYVKMLKSILMLINMNAARFNCGVSSIGAALKRLNITVKKDVKPS